MKRENEQNPARGYQERPSIFTTTIRRAVPVAVIVLLLVAVTAFVWFGPAVQKVVRNDKVFETTYQFLLVTGLGGVFAWHRKRLERRHQEKTMLRKIYSELLGAFNQAKKVRRRLRASTGVSFSPDAPITASEYEAQLELLNDSQLIFESYAKRAQDRWLWFREGTSLAKALGTVEAYLNEIIAEFEAERSRFESALASRPVSGLPRLAEFLEPHPGADFRSRFKLPMQIAFAELGKLTFQ